MAMELLVAIACTALHYCSPILIDMYPSDGCAFACLKQRKHRYIHVTDCSHKKLSVCAQHHLVWPLKWKRSKTRQDKPRKAEARQGKAK